jgi:hypothetical protein
MRKDFSGFRGNYVPVYGLEYGRKILGVIPSVTR